MDAARTQLKEKNNGFGGRLLIPAVILTVIAGAGLLFLTGETELSKSFPYLYLLPWIALAGIVIMLPTLYQLVRTSFDLSHPLVLPAISYFFPAFVLGGLLLASGLSQPYFMHFIEDPEYHLPLTFVYVALGFGGLIAGFLIPQARMLGALASRRIPVWDWDSQTVLVPGLILLGVGVAFYLISWFAGIVGYQTVNLADSLSGVSFFLSLLFLEAGFLLWMAVFKAPRINTNFIAALVIFFAAVPVRIILGGNRSGLLQILIVIMLAYFLAGRRLKAKQTAIFASLGALALILGMAYGTTFRNIKGSEGKTSLTDYVDNALLAIDTIGNQDMGKTLEKAGMDIAERIEVSSSLAVVVANYEKLAPYEAAYGLENNIWTYTWTAFIPRFIWSDKPLVSDARAYSDLYFNVSDNSFAITPMGDLLRNFGPAGVPLGMLVLGFVLRIIYGALIENQVVTLGRGTLYYMLITSISYEGFYGTILPQLLRAGIVCFISLVLIGLFIGKKRV